MPKKRFVPRKRKSTYRDAKLIVIAAEGEKTEKKYFESLAVEYAASNIHIEVLVRTEKGSDPKTVIRALDKFKRQYALKKGYDQLWLVADVDRWKEQMLSEVAKLCHQKGYGNAISNPCFEIWLLLHIKNILEYDEPTLQEFRENKKTGTRTRLKRELVNLLGSYNSSNPSIEPFIPHVDKAVERARQLDAHPEHRWPNDLGTRVYLLAEQIISTKQK
jgi:hypothetical protein